MRERPLTEFISKRSTQEKKGKPKTPKGLKGPWELPEGWRWVRLEEISIKIISGGTPSRVKKEYFKGHIPWFKAKELNDDYLHDSEEHITKEALKNSSAKLLPPGTIIIGMYDTAAGKLGILTKPAATNQACAGVVINQEKAQIKFVFYSIKALRQYYILKRRGTRQQNLNLSMVKGFPIPLPPLSEQKRIVAKLDELNKHIEEAKRLAREARKEAEKLMASALHEVFSKAEEKGWEWEKLSELVSLESGSRPKGGVKEIKQGIPSLGAEHLRWDGSFNFKNIRFVPIEFYNSLKKGKIRMSDILLVL